jgi:ribosomal subunit interface protein
MTLRISGKSISVGEALRSRVSERTDECCENIFDGNYSGHITLSKDGFGFRTDCALHLDSGVVLEADSSAADAYASADQALLMIEKRPAPLQEPAEGPLGAQDARRQCRLCRDGSPGAGRAELRHRGAGP